MQGYKPKGFRSKAFHFFYTVHDKSKKRQEGLPVKKRAVWALVEGISKAGIYQFSY